ncbi:putative GTP pyrophosphokinase [Anaerocolumna jejuensis DSM 15929]|uniref:Putative GTP pyrophosphokinase n=1 Tax=Anaerocolumna jejuensis DSM 15929 TaxID=1121322 RepID=A0A1M6XSI4_9FIRM|nr:GTP pyrophosphokinase family protein [Anaerocolumna jejuensis]SHL08868.1 putative GTP pyrophosphokinase [Anaerocolumna jejuensis DSM 15929]
MDLPIFYSEEDEWKKVILMYDSALKEVNTKLEILNNEFKLNHQYNPIEHITSRIKTPQSIAKKLRHNNRELTVENIVKYINDVAGIRIICSFTSDIYRIADLIAAQSDVNVLKVKDYITCPKPNGYTSYHMIISVPIFLSETMINVKVEIQIRTIAMDFWASLEHKIYYKFEGNAPERIRKELKECAEIVSFLDHKMLSLNEEIKLFNPDSEMDHYREVVSETFQNMIRESYGTVVEEDIIKEEEGQEEKYGPEDKGSQSDRQEMYEELFEETVSKQPDSLEEALEKVEESKEKSKFFRFFKHNVMNEEMDKM